MATKFPQDPHNLLEEIICDADLDFLGRTDFYPIGNSLFEELQDYQLIGDLQSWLAEAREGNPDPIVILAATG